MKHLIISLLSLAFFNVMANINQDASVIAHKEKLRKELQNKSDILSACLKDCSTTSPNLSKIQCESQKCSSQKNAYNQVRQKINEINMSQNVVNTKQSSLNQMLGRWNTCQSRCQNDPNTNHSADHCKNVVCEREKKSYNSYKQASDTMNENLDKINKDNKDNKDNNGNVAQGEDTSAVVNQIRKTKDKVGVLGYVAAGTTAFLGYKAAVCAGSCPGGTCCTQAPLFGAMAVAAGVQTAQMFKKRNDLNQTCLQLSSSGSCLSPEVSNCPGIIIGGVCQPNSSLADCLSPNVVINGECQPPAPGCELNPSSSFCNNPSTFTTGDNCPPGDPSCKLSTGLDGVTSSTKALTAGVVESLSKEFKPKGGWPDGKNPFKDNEELDYNNLSEGQKATLAKAMKGFNQKKNDYIAQNNLLEDSDESSGLLAENSEEPELDLSAGFPGVKDSSSSALAGKSMNKMRRKKRGRGPDSTIDKMKEMLQKLGASRGEGKGQDLSQMSVSIGNDNVGVREDNIFLMVHRMNRSLDEEHSLFIADF